jgi:hypothetical protein
LFGGQFSYSCTFHDREGTGFDQYRDIVKLGNPFVNFEFENDASGHDIFKFPWMPDHTSSDMYYTGEGRLQIFGLEIGSATFTGNRGPNDGTGVGPGGPYGTYKTDAELGYYPDKYRAGVLYLKIGPFKFGPNNEDIRNSTQNWLHDLIGTPRFKYDPEHHPDKWLWQFGW